MENSHEGTREHQSPHVLYRRGGGRIRIAKRACKISLNFHGPSRVYKRAGLTTFLVHDRRRKPHYSTLHVSDLQGFSRSDSSPVSASVSASSVSFSVVSSDPASSSSLGHELLFRLFLLVIFLSLRHRVLCLALSQFQSIQVPICLCN